MPHSGGGGSHSGGSHGGSHSSGGGSSTRVSSTPFEGSHAYAIYDRHGHSRLVYTNTKDYHAEVTKKDMIIHSIFGGIFMLPGIIEFIVIIFVIASFFHTGVKKTEISPSMDDTVYIYDTMDLVTDEEEQRLATKLEDFRDKTGIIPAVEFTTDDAWYYDYENAEAFAYNEYVCKFMDEKHLLILYSYGASNDGTGFNEFHWESMWGDDLSRTASSSDESYLTDTLQRNLTVANGTGVADAIGTSFDTFFEHLDARGFRFEAEKLFVILFLLIHGGIFFAVGFVLMRSTQKKYKESQESGETTYKITGEPVILVCEYCGTNYYKGTIGNCPNCGAPLQNQ